MSVTVGTETAQPIALATGQRSRHLTKRAFDVVCALVLIVLLAPLLAVIALAISLDSRGWPIFRQVRVGLRGRRFVVTKFRTMVVDAEQQVAALKAQSEDPHWLLLRRDPRTTRVGRVLRMTSLDELPQLWNVLRGEMSLVGPRPLTPDDDLAVTGAARVRGDVRPGMTGLWQVSGRTKVSFEEMLSLDCEYVASSSFGRDLLLIVRTIPAVLFARGAN